MPGLELILALSELTDFSFCEATASELQKDDRRWEVRRATPELWEQLPLSRGLYMFVFVPPLELRIAQRPQSRESFRYTLYVGKAGAGDSDGTFRSRYKSDYCQHVAQNPERLWEPHSRSRADLLAKYLNLYPLEYWFLEVAERDTISRLETSLIKLLNPPLNIQGTIKMRPGKPGPAFVQGGRPDGQ